MSNQTNNPRIGNSLNSFVLEGLVAYPIKRYSTSKKNNPYVVFFLQQKFVAKNGKKFTRGFQVHCFNPEYVDNLTYLTNKTYVRAVGNVLVDIFTTKEGKKVTRVKLAANEVEVLEDTNISLEDRTPEGKINIKEDYDANIFSLSGRSELKPFLSTSKNGNEFASLFITQTRKAGANYEEYKRYYTILTFEDNVIANIKKLNTQFDVAYSGQINTNKQGAYYTTTLVANNINILARTDEPFLDVSDKKQKVNAPEPEFEPSPKIEIEDDDLPF